MEFDADTLEPLYRLRIGEAGHSYAFVIAPKLGIPESIIARSREITEAGMARDNTALIQKVSSESDDEAEETRPEEYVTLSTDKQDKLMNDEDHQDVDSPSSSIN